MHGTEAIQRAWVGATVQIGDPRYILYLGRQSANGGSRTAAGNYAIEYTDQEIGQTNAVVHAKVNNPNRVQIDPGGLQALGR